MTISAKIVLDSVGPSGVRLTTMQLRYPKFIHGEFMTHRVFSRNASSSRAIPVLRLINDVINDRVEPVEFGRNQAGMQAGEKLWGEDLDKAREAWNYGRDSAITAANMLAALNVHKQVVNRVIENYVHINVVVTATEWDNFFELRCHLDAQPDMQALAEAMRDARNNSTPTPLAFGSWHTPYVIYTDELRQRFMPSEFAQIAVRLSVARCARVSYLTQDGKEPSVEEDMGLYQRLVGSVPLHVSPAEHQASPDVLTGRGRMSWLQPERHGNFVGWVQYRKTLEEMSKAAGGVGFPKSTSA